MFVHFVDPKSILLMGCDADSALVSHSKPGRRLVLTPYAGGPTPKTHPPLKNILHDM